VIRSSTELDSKDGLKRLFNEKCNLRNSDLFKKFSTKLSEKLDEKRLMIRMCGISYIKDMISTRDVSQYHLFLDIVKKKYYEKFLF
jgi:hypothetical protein